jgi:hypothetical protein
VRDSPDRVPFLIEHALHLFVRFSAPRISPQLSEHLLTKYITLMQVEISPALVAPGWKARCNIQPLPVPAEPQAIPTIILVAKRQAKSI